jgi:dephospho-CoA kinase
MTVTGLTGGLASGKSTVARVLAEHGVPVIDADAVSRGQVLPGSAVLAAIAREFGAGVLAPDGTLDRRALGRLVFGDPDRLARLNALTHGRVLDEIARRLAVIAASGCRGAVVESALLFEAGLDGALDRVVAVIAPADERVRRAQARDGLSAEEALARIASQVPDEVRAARAAIVVANDGAIEALVARSRALAVEITTLDR